MSENALLKNYKRSKIIFIKWYDDYEMFENRFGADLSGHSVHTKKKCIY